MDVGCTGRGDDLVHGDGSAVVAVCDIGGDGVVKEGRFLGHDAHLLAVPAEVQRLQVLAVHQLHTNGSIDSTSLGFVN